MVPVRTCRLPKNDPLCAPEIVRLQVYLSVSFKNRAKAGEQGVDNIAPQRKGGIVRKYPELPTLRNKLTGATGWLAQTLCRAAQ
jgi:hypothetical protein